MINVVIYWGSPLPFGEDSFNHLLYMFYIRRNYVVVRLYPGPIAFLPAAESVSWTDVLIPLIHTSWHGCCSAR